MYAVGADGFFFCHLLVRVVLCSIPTLAVAWAAARLRGARFVIDWHNFGYTILSLSLGQRSAVTRAVIRVCVLVVLRRLLVGLCMA